MNFYVRNAKKEDIDKFKKDRGLKALGMPEFIASGTHEIQQLSHRFIVLPRFGRDIAKFFAEQNNQFPLHTVYRLGWQILNVLEYIHQCGYVHGDIKGSNILLGFGKGGDEQCHLLDFGLACKFSTKEFKPDPKKMHNGTIEYTPRDAHQGVPTIRGDIEILAYNLIEWAGAKLPWVVKKLLEKPVEVQRAKEEFMRSPDNSLKSCFGSIPVPAQLAQLFKYLVSMQPDTVPDYKKIRQMFEAGIKECGAKNSGPLDFSAAKKPKESQVRGRPEFNKKSPKKAVNEEPKAGPSKKPAATKRAPAKQVVESEEEESPPKKPAPKAKAAAPENTRTKRTQNRKVYVENSDSEDEIIAATPKKRTKASEPERSASKENHDDLDNNASPPAKKPKVSEKKEKGAKGETTPEGKTTHVTLKSKSGKKNKKTIHLSLNLDVSLNSDVVLKINRKDKKSKKTDSGDEKSDDDGTPNRAGVYKGKHAKAK